MSLDSIKLSLARFAPIEAPKPLVNDIKPEPANAKGTSFSDMFSNAIKEVDQMQKEADQQIEGLTLGKEGYTSHGAMIALEKADTAFQLMSNIRVRIVRAYEDIMRTAV